MDQRTTWADFICMSNILMVYSIDNNLSRFTLVYKIDYNVFIPYTSITAATGGLLGLGFGFSILSAAELFYFFLFRWFYYWCLSKKNKKFIHALEPDISFIERHPEILSRPYQYQRRRRVNIR